MPWFLSSWRATLVPCIQHVYRNPSHSEDFDRVSREDSSLLRKEHQFDSTHRIEMFTGTTA